MVLQKNKKKKQNKTIKLKNSLIYLYPILPHQETIVFILIVLLYLASGL